MRILEGHTADVMSLAFAPDGRRLVSAGWDGTVRVWDPLEGRALRCIATPNNHAYSVAFTPDSQYVAAGFRHNLGKGAFTGFGTVACFPVEARGNRHPDSISAGDTWFDAGVRCVAFFPSGKFLATLSVEHSGGPNINVWDLRERKARLQISAEFSMQAFAFRPDGMALAAISPRAGEGLFVYDLNVGREGPNLHRRQPHGWFYLDDEGRALAYSPDGWTLAGAFKSGNIVCWKPDMPDPPRQCPAHTGPAQAIVFSPDGRRLLSSGSDGVVRLWDSANLSLLTTYDWKLGDIRCLAFAPDGLTAAAGGNGPILLWDVDG